MRATSDIESLIERISKEGKMIRKTVFDAVLYSEGSFNLNEIWSMPFYYFEEVIEAMSDKNEKIKQATQKSNKKTF